MATKTEQLTEREMFLDLVKRSLFIWVHDTLQGENYVVVYGTDLHADLHFDTQLDSVAVAAHWLNWICE